MSAKASRYIIEGNIDFYQSLQQEDEVDYNDTNKCLITHEPLDPATAVTLECNHTFNYLPLYKYVVTSKQNKFNHLEYKSLKASQLKCPFCRHVQNTLMPLPPAGIDAKPIHGVNVLEYSGILSGTCSYTTPSGEVCPSTTVYLAYHDNQTYCFHHRHLMKQKWDKEEKQKHKCGYLFQRGIHKGQPCGKTITTNLPCGLCVTHFKQQQVRILSTSGQPDAVAGGGGGVGDPEKN